jgi:anthranilate 1,2-dioxygenase large subunit
LHWTVFGYRDDDDALRQMRLMQSNLIGPAGFVSIDDGVIGEWVQRGILGRGAYASAVMEMAGAGSSRPRVRARPKRLCAASGTAAGA